MALQSHEVVEGTRKVPVWIDVLSALWIVVASLSFVVEILVEMRAVPEDMVSLVAVGQYAYAVLIISCVVGVGLAVVRSLARKH